MPSQHTYSALKGFRQSQYATGSAYAYLVGRRKDTGLWEVIAHGEFDTTIQSMQYITGYAEREYPGLNYTWLGAMSDESIKEEFKKDQQKA